MKKLKKKKLKSIGLAIATIISVISGVMTMDSWVKDKYSQESQPVQQTIIYGDVVIDNTYESIKEN